MDRIQVEGYAKINLGLDVIRRMENGYHEVKMVMQTVDISDTITLTKRPAGIVFSTESGEIPADDTNLAYKAARLFLEALEKKVQDQAAFEEKAPLGEGTFCGNLGGVEIELIKRIPVAAGMAGGSTDAAAVLRGMNTLFFADFSTEELKEIGLKIGADVPYCIVGGTALAEGIGEKLTMLPAAEKLPILVVKPDIFVSTKDVYQGLKLDENTIHPDMDAMVEVLCNPNKKTEEIIPYMGNVLQTVTEKLHPVVGDIIEKMHKAGAKRAMMSGSGPSVFGIFESADEAKQAAKVFSDYRQVYVTNLI